MSSSEETDQTEEVSAVQPGTYQRLLGGCPSLHPAVAAAGSSPNLVVAPCENAVHLVAKFQIWQIRLSFTRDLFKIVDTTTHVEPRLVSPQYTFRSDPDI